MNVNEYLDDILKEIKNKKIDNVISKLDFNVKNDFSNEEKNKILKISKYLINNDLTIYNDEPLINVINMLDNIKTNDSYFYMGSIYYDLALKNQSIEYFKKCIKNLIKCEETEEIFKILSDSYFYIFILSKEEDTKLIDLIKAQKYLIKSNNKDLIEMFKIEYNFCGFYFKKSSFKKAIFHGLKALKAKNDPDSFDLLPELYCIIGLCYIKIENYKKAIYYYRQAIDMIYTSKDIDLALLKEALFNLAESYNALNNNHLELKTRIALKNILDENENEDLELIYINSKELAYIEKFNNQLSYAIKDAKTSLKIARKINVSLDRLYEAILLVAYVYYDLENYELYIKYLKDSIATAKLITPEELSFELLTNSLNELATHYFLLGDDNCIDYYLELKEQYNKKLDTLDHKNINNYVDANLSLAKILSNKKEFNDALYMLEDIKSFIAKKCKNDKSYFYELSLIYNRLGIIYSDLGEIQKTIDYFILAINTFKKTESNDNSEILEPYYSNLANAYIETEEYELAINTLNNKLETLDIIYNGKNIADYIDAKADILFEIAEQYKNLNDENNSKKIYEEIIELLENNLDINSINIKDKLANAYDRYATILTNENDDDLIAVSYFKKSKEIFKQLIKFNPNYALHVVFENNSIAYCYQNIPENDLAISTFNESIQLLKKYKKNYNIFDDFTYAIALRGLAILYDIKEDVSKAEKYYIDAINVFEKLYKEQQKDNYFKDLLIYLYNNLIKFYDHIMNYEKKKKYEYKFNKINGNK